MPASVAEAIPGQIFIGTIFNVCLMGIMTTQVFLYHTTYKNDKMWMKVFVWFLYLADILHSIFMVLYLYNDLIVHFGDVEHLLVSNWIFATDPALTGIIGGSVQLFFAWRVKKLTNNHWLVGIISLTAVAECLAAIGTAIYCGIIPNFTEFRRFKYIVTIWLVCSVIADILITGSLVWHLRRQKRGFTTTDDVIDRIIRMTVQTGMITAVWAFIDLVLYLTDPTALHLVFNITLSKLYTNSLMSTLNSRRGWKFTTSPDGSGSCSLDVHRADVVQLSGQSRPEVFVHVESREILDPISKCDKSDKSDGESIEKSKVDWEEASA